MVQPRKRKTKGEKAELQSSLTTGASKTGTSKKRAMKDESDDNTTANLAPIESPKTLKKPRTTDSATPKLLINFQKISDSQRSASSSSRAGQDGRKYRAKKQRMVILHHEIHGADWSPVIKFKIAGSTGNVYTILIKQSPSCDCPDFSFRRARCKHIIYALVNALSVDEDDVLQKLFSSAELSEMIKSSALTRVDKAVSDATQTTSTTTRRPIQDECAICFTEMTQSQQIVWCEAGCGNNLHEQCFRQWALTCTEKATCVYCRATWGGQSESNLEAILAKGTTSGGYTNVGGQLGLSPVRDMYLSS